MLRREVPAHFHAHRADDILTAIRIAKEFELDYVIVHGTDGHLIADILAEEGARVICGPLLTDRSKPELFHQKMELPAEYLPLSAAMAVRAGMEPEAALRAITIDAARIAGIDGRVGSLKPGKDADLVICSAHPFDMNCKVLAVFIDGRRI